MVIRIGLGALAALVVGALLGATSRGLMALVTLAAGKEISFSWSGTAFIVMLYVAVMIPAGVVAGLTTHWSRWLLPTAGALFLCVPAIGIGSVELGATADFSVAQWLGVGTAAAGIFGTVVLLPLLTVRLADHWLGRRPAPPQPRADAAEELQAAT